VSADDFGLTKTTNQGIAKAYNEGIATCIQFMPSGAAFEHALGLAQELGLKEAGAHLALTETRPVTQSSKIPTLVTSGNGFYKSHKAFLLRFISGLIDIDQAYIELRNQLDILNTSGVRITNLSSHEHIHMLPAFLEMFIRLAKEYDIPSIRFPHRDRAYHTGIDKTLKAAVLFFLERLMKRKLQASTMAFPDHFRGFLASGSMNEDEVLWTIGSLEEGTTECVCHPGYLGPDVLENHPFHRNCESELSALLSGRVRNLIEERGVQLLSYGTFLSEFRRVTR
jgi:predicted glycoside hydrolase/deacetylase ChbG (UPF0249 family)